VELRRLNGLSLPLTVEWEYATSFNRLHPLTTTVGRALGLTDMQIDAMWTAALNL
jgi:hypothetical protein